MDGLLQPGKIVLCFRLEKVQRMRTRGSSANAGMRPFKLRHAHQMGREEP